MDKATKLQAQGTIERGKGRARRAAGTLTGNKRQEAKGALESAKGRVKQATSGAARRARRK